MQSADVCHYKPEDRINGRRETTCGERTPLINTTVGTDLGVGGFVVHSVLCGINFPFGKDICEVQVVLLSAVQHGLARDILEGSLEVKSKKDSASARY